jgi:hypothetical protein
METTIYTIDGKEYKTFTLRIYDVYMTIASSALNEKIEQMIEDNRYDEVIHIDETYGFVLPENVDENENDIRESIETIINEPSWQE